MAKEKVSDVVLRSLMQEAAREKFQAMDIDDQRVLMGEAIKDQIEEFDLQPILAPLLREHALARTRAILQEKEFDQAFQKAIEHGVTKFLRALPKATAVAMVGMFTGIKDYNSGTIYQALKDMVELSEQEERRTGSPRKGDVPF